MRNDVGDRLAVNRQRDPLTGLHRINDLRRPIAQVTNSDLHVRQRSTAAARLAKLAELRDRGVLTDDEFDAQKRKLLGS
jgi:hypothetical protein